MSTAAKVGAFFIAVLILAGLMIWKIEGIRLGGPRQKIRVEFKDIAGLDEKSTVRLAGVRVGKVSKISLNKDQAVVELALDKEVDLRRGASAAISSLGLLGEKYVELIPGPVGASTLPEDALLKGDTPVTFDQITKLARDIELDVKDISSNLNKSLGGTEGEERLRTIVENVRIITEDLRVMISANRGNVDSTLGNFKEFSATMTRLVERIDRLIASNEANVTQGIANIRDVSHKIETTADNLNQITGRIKEGEGTVGKLVQSDETHKNLNDALIAVKEGVGGLNKALGSIGKVKIDLGIRSELLTRFSKGKAYFTLDINPGDSPRYYRLELSSQPFGRRIDSTITQRTIFPDGHIEVTTTDTQELKDDFAISALFGYRYKGLGLRAGVIESKGGAGLDYMLLKDRLRFSADIWDFNHTDFSAHAKLAARYYFSPSVFVSGGWDDPLNRSRKADSLFFGAGVRWNDDDIKYLMGSLPIKP